MDAARPPAPAADRATPAWRQRLGSWRQWPRETRDTLFQLALIAWVVGPHLTHLAPWVAAFTALVLLWRARLALRGAPLPGRWLLGGVLAAAVGLTVLTEQSLLGKTAGITLLVLLMALKTLELRARRDALVVFFLGFFLVLTHCLYSQSLLMALHMLLSTWGLLTAVVLANMPVGKPPLWRAAALAARSALLGLPLMAALFLLFPRFGPLWGLPQDAGGAPGCRARCAWAAWPTWPTTRPSASGCASRARRRRTRRCTSAARCCRASTARNGGPRPSARRARPPGDRTCRSRARRWPTR